MISRSKINVGINNSSSLCQHIIIGYKIKFKSKHGISYNWEHSTHVD